ncbi:hypothetical protein VPNG_01788 [Cytospora leucostoma]|uniref:DOMON domain-containing protein n=1 Tax=Cytospora leucostoma TaxID=1230097 RepID=A0A423XIC9_9PEZI|nr:hypothetical protein VPNG_01788 [Cytospora leucostoma]
MHGYSGRTAAAAVLYVAAIARAATVSYCPSGDICYAVGIPQTTASTGSGNIYFQISAPTSYQWVALGTGQHMAGANIFLIYQDGNGNVTVSPRQATGHFEPQYEAATASAIELLSGSGVSGDTMVANVRCSDCQAWSSGTLDVAGTSAPWIGAWRGGSSLDSSSLSEDISVHDDETQFKLDLTQASVDTDSNPFIGNEATTSDSGSGSTSSSVSVKRPNKQIIWAHGLCMAIAFAILYPLGAALMPLFNKWYIHGGVQVVTWFLMWAAFGLGVVGAQQRHLLFNNTHTQLGTVVVTLLAIQPALGYLHHIHYLKKGSRGIISHGHIWWGRILMAIGVINGGLGLQLTNAGDGLIIAYSIVAAVMFLAYAIVKTIVSIRRKPQGNAGGNRRKESGAESSRYVEYGNEVPLSSFPDRQSGHHRK